MGILDEKGRLLGRINLIDLVALVAAVLLAGLFVFGYRLYSSGYRELVRQEIKDEAKWAPRQSYSTSKTSELALILYAKIPGYFRDEISVGDAETWSQETDFPLKLLALQPVAGKPGRFFLLLGGKVPKSATGMWFAGRGRPLRIGETFPFMTKNYKISGEIIRVLPGKIDSKSLPHLTRDLRIDD
ncbi:MAG: DUF4330 family protein [Nitrospinota bacterium]